MGCNQSKERVNPEQAPPLDPEQAPPLDPELWARECFSNARKQLTQLEKVYRATIDKLRNYDHGRAALTSFRRRGPNEFHGLLHRADAILKTMKVLKIAYSHYQSGHENTLFGFGPSTASFAAGGKACATEAETKAYKSLNMREYWYIEWLAVLHHIATNGGLLLLFDLQGEGAMSTSPNCVMELALLYQLFGEDLVDTYEMRNRIQLVVITDDDLGDGVDLAKRIEEKLDNGQKKQLELFKQAYEKCSKVLEDARATKYLGRWIRDFAQVVGTEEKKVYGQVMTVSKVAYLQKAFLRLLNDRQLREYLEDVMTDEEWVNEFVILDVSYNKKLTEIPPLPPMLRQLICNSCSIKKLPALPSTLETLWCQQNKITELPALPATLKKLDCERNKITMIPTLPLTLEVLRCYGNSITALPALPPTLEELYCFENSITKLPALPSTLFYLDCRWNKLTVTPQQKAAIQAQAPNCTIEWDYW